FAPPETLREKGTPRKGPSGSVPAASLRARSKDRWITALSFGFSDSIAAIARSTSSLGEASRLRTNSACAVASRLVSVLLAMAFCASTAAKPTLHQDRKRRCHRSDDAKAIGFAIPDALVAVPDGAKRDRTLLP